MKGILIILFFLSLNLSAQEFPKGGVLNLEYFNGFTSKFNSDPELFLTELRLTPQLTVVPGLLRFGIAAGLQYNNKNLSGLVGPVLAFKIKTVKVEKLQSSLANLQLVIENLYGSVNRQKLIGGGIKIEVGQMVLISITGHRDYKLDAWHFRFGLGYNFNRNKIPEL